MNRPVLCLGLSTLLVFTFVERVHATSVRQNECRNNQFKCTSTQTCISRNWVCDSEIDCRDGEDEAACEGISHCDPDDFTCRSGECIPEQWRCDGDADCEDSSDERQCETFDRQERRGDGNGETN